MTARQHSESCKHCKTAILTMLGSCYGKVAQNFNLGVSTTIASYEGTVVHKPLERIYWALVGHRGFDNFVRRERLSPVDFFVDAAEQFILEFDESQHFTKPRAIALDLYPSMPLGFDKGAWIDRCLKLDRHDPLPPYRDEQRAWYDTLRDFVVLTKGIRIVRVLPQEINWCSLDPANAADRLLFKNLVDKKLEAYT